MLFGVLSPVAVCAWSALIGDATTAAQLQGALATGSNWTFVVRDDSSSGARMPPGIDVVVGSGSHPMLSVLVPPLPAGRPPPRLYQYLYTGVDRLLPQIPAALTVCNVHQAADAIAEYVMAGVLGWCVRLAAADAAMRACAWNGTSSAGCGAMPTHRQAKGQTIGVLGYGHIGEGIATRAAAFGMRVIGTTLDPPAAPPPPLAWLGSDANNSRLVRESDFLVVAVPDVPATLSLVGAPLLEQMRATAVLINVASARVVDEAALHGALATGALGGAIVDTWWNRAWQDPGASGAASEPSAFRFDLLPNVVMDATLSTHTAESAATALAEAAANLDAFARGQPLANIVRNGTQSSTTLGDAALDSVAQSLL